MRFSDLACPVFAVILSLLVERCGSDEVTRPRNLILSTQKGLLTHEVRVFLASLRSVACDAEVVIFSADDVREDLDDLAETFNARFISYDADALSATEGPMNLHRFTLFQEFLLQHEDQPFDSVFLCDVRDVLFQQDPFEALGVASGIGVALEPAHLPIGKCDIHSRWLSVECAKYAEEEVLAVVGERARACAGTTLGTHAAVTRYCQLMRQEARRTVVEVDERQGRLFQGRSTTTDGKRWMLWCNDQGMHNALLWTGRLAQEMDVTLYRAETSKLVTVGTLQYIRMNQDGEVLTDCAEDDPECASGSVAAVVHQYDRVKALTVLAQNLYGLPGEEFQTFFERYSLPSSEQVADSAE